MIQGYIYIASAFESLTPSGCLDGEEVDNDPHLWTNPYTWGICRPDIRNRVKEGDYVFFVLGSRANLPQMIFAFIRVAEIITHYQAYHKAGLETKRMTGKKLEGNILCNSDGDYNPFDNGLHQTTFDKRKLKYVIADMENSKFLTPQEIKSKSKDFVKELNRILYKNGSTAIEIITRAGQSLTEEQTKELLKWTTDS